MTSKQIKDALKICSEIFTQNERFIRSDKIIYSAINKFPGNQTIENVLPKVMLINSFYSTQIYNTNLMAEHIVNIQIDHLLKDGDPLVIEKIRHGHGVVSKKYNNEIDFYSFASKYAALHKPANFPIFDSLVMKLLTAVNKNCLFHNRFTQKDLRDYQVFISVIDSLMEFTDLHNFKYKQIDQGLWIWGKYLYERSNLTEDEIQVLNRYLLN